MSVQSVGNDNAMESAADAGAGWPELHRERRTIVVLDVVDSVRMMQAHEAEYSRRRELILQSLPNVLAPEGGFFAMLDLRATGQPSDAIRKRLLAEFGIVVVHGAAYGPGGEGTLRVSFASGGDVLDRGLAKLSQALRQ